MKSSMTLTKDSPTLFYLTRVGATALGDAVLASVENRFPESLALKLAISLPKAFLASAREESLKALYSYDVASVNTLCFSVIPENFSLSSLPKLTLLIAKKTHVVAISAFLGLLESGLKGAFVGSLIGLSSLVVRSLWKKTS